MLSVFSCRSDLFLLSNINPTFRNEYHGRTLCGSVAATAPLFIPASRTQYLAGMVRLIQCNSCPGIFPQNSHYFPRTDDHSVHILCNITRSHLCYDACVIPKEWVSSDNSHECSQRTLLNNSSSGMKNSSEIQGQLYFTDKRLPSEITVRRPLSSRVWMCLYRFSRCQPLQIGILYLKRVSIYNAVLAAPSENGNNPRQG